MKRSTKIIDGYEMKHSPMGGYRIVEYYHFKNEQVRKRTIAKNLNQSDAEDMLWKLENKSSAVKGH